MIENAPAGFYDLCINPRNDDPGNLRVILSRLQKLGYGTVAVNRNLDESSIGTEKKKKKKNREDNESNHFVVPEPLDLEGLAEEFQGKLRLLSRITFACSDPAKTHPLAHCANLKKYNLYAVAPKTQNALQFACSQLNADLIVLKASTTGLKLNRKLYQQAVERGLCFEIQYGELLDTDTRKQAIYYAHLFHAYGKSKNVLLSSGAGDLRTIRDPYDLANLSSLLGLSEVKSKASVLHQCKTLLLKAERRRRGKAVFVIENAESKKNEESEDDHASSKKLKLQAHD